MGSLTSLEKKKEIPSKMACKDGDPDCLVQPPNSRSVPKSIGEGASSPFGGRPGVPKMFLALEQPLRTPRPATEPQNGPTRNFREKYRKNTSRPEILDSQNLPPKYPENTEKIPPKYVRQKLTRKMLTKCPIRGLFQHSDFFVSGHFWGNSLRQKKALYMFIFSSFLPKLNFHHVHFKFI